MANVIIETLTIMICLSMARAGRDGLSKSPSSLQHLRYRTRAYIHS